MKMTKRIATMVACAAMAASSMVGMSASAESTTNNDGLYIKATPYNAANKFSQIKLNA